MSSRSAGVGSPCGLRDVARVQYGPDIRRGAADLNGTGETVGGIVVMRIGSNALDVIRALEGQIATLRLPDGVRLIPTYDRSELIVGSVNTLTNTLMQQAVIVTIICLVFLFHARSALIVMIVLPMSVLMSFIAIRYLGLTSNIMSLGGIAIAVGELADAVIVLIENAHVRLAAAPAGSDRKRVIVDACKEVGRPIFFSLLLITISFLPIFTLAGQAGRLFMPLAYTKTFAMFAAAILSITLAPPLMVLLLRGRFRTEATNPVSRLLSAVYRPVATLVVRARVVVVLAAIALMVATVPVFQRLGSEFMPPLDEGSLLVMPTTFPGIAIEEARRALVAQNRIIMRFPEVQSVHGKAGRAETATDPAQLDMIESVVMLKPREQWPTTYSARWHSPYAPDWLKETLLRRLWPEQQARTLAQLSRDLDAALRMPGYQMAIAPPIRTRIDMLTTGVRTPVGVKVFGENLDEIERISIHLEGLLRQVAGTRSTFAERQTGREYVDIVPDRAAIARYGLTVRDVQDVVEAAIGGMPVSTAIAGRARFSINLRVAADQRSDPEALRALLVPVPSTGALVDVSGTNTGAGASGAGAGLVGLTAAQWRWHGRDGRRRSAAGHGLWRHGVRRLSAPDGRERDVGPRLPRAVAPARRVRPARPARGRAGDDRPADDQGRERRARRLRLRRHRPDPARSRRLGRRCEGRRRCAADAAGRLPAAVDRPVRVPGGDGSPSSLRHPAHARPGGHPALPVDAGVAADLPRAVQPAVRGRRQCLAALVHALQPVDRGLGGPHRRGRGRSRRPASS